MVVAMGSEIGLTAGAQQHDGQATNDGDGPSCRPHLSAALRWPEGPQQPV